MSALFMMNYLGDWLHGYMHMDGISLDCNIEKLTLMGRLGKLNNTTTPNRLLFMGAAAVCLLRVERTLHSPHMNR